MNSPQFWPDVESRDISWRFWLRRRVSELTCLFQKRNTDSEIVKGTEKHFFMKTGKGKDAQVMFAGEHASLNAIHTIPSLCPASFAHGPLEDATGGAFLVTDFLDMCGTSSGTEKGSGMSLAAKLAKLHITPAPVPEGFLKPVFGFPVPSKWKHYSPIQLS